MRALHTADWHIGQTLNGWSRETEHKLFLVRLADALEEEEIDLLLVAGDIFDNTNPSGESQQLLFRALAEFKRRSPNLVIVMLGEPAILQLELRLDRLVHREAWESFVLPDSREYTLERFMALNHRYSIGP